MIVAKSGPQEYNWTAQHTRPADWGSHAGIVRPHIVSVHHTSARCSWLTAPRKRSSVSRQIDFITI